MGSNLEVMKRYIELAWSNPPLSIMEASATYLSDEFQSLDEDGNAVMNKEAYIGMGQLMAAAFDDFKWVLDGFREEGDAIIMSGHFEGTHTGDLDLSAIGVGIVPASGKKIVWPHAVVKYKIEGDQVLSEQPYDGASGMKAMLAPLGVKLPSA